MSDAIAKEQPSWCLCDSQIFGDVGGLHNLYCRHADMEVLHDKLEESRNTVAVLERESKKMREILGELAKGDQP